MEVIVAAQIRAARALLNWSQQNLAEEAGVSVTTIRDIESQRRSADTNAMRELRRAVELAGVRFVAGDVDGGPGVRLLGGRPHLARRPEMVKKWGLTFSVEWQGHDVDVLVSYEAVADLGGLSTWQPEAAYLKVFADHHDEIFDAVTAALKARTDDRYAPVIVTANDISGLIPLKSLST